jgi:hypothetical protein
MWCARACILGGCITAERFPTGMRPLRLGEKTGGRFICAWEMSKNSSFQAFRHAKGTLLGALCFVSSGRCSFVSPGIAPSLLYCLWARGTSKHEVRAFSWLELCLCSQGVGCVNVNICRCDCIRGVLCTLCTRAPRMFQTITFVEHHFFQRVFGVFHLK